jgi:hypothetical protein
MSETSKDKDPERITVLAKDFLPAAMEYHRRNMGAKGYELEGRITQRRFQLIDGMGPPKDLLDGEVYFAATFVKKETAGS